jgi:hypothetical protein
MARSGIGKEATVGLDNPKFGAENTYPDLRIADPRQTLVRNDLPSIIKENFQTPTRQRF